MEDEEEDGGLFNIQLSSSSSDDDDTSESTKKLEKVPRDFQSEEDFQKVKTEYRVKIEVGELWKTLKLPVDNPTKSESQTILHAIEELYFYRRYEQAQTVTEEALRGELTEEYRKLLEDYLGRCKIKLRGGGQRK